MLGKLSWKETLKKTSTRKLQIRPLSVSKIQKRYDKITRVAIRRYTKSQITQIYLGETGARGDKASPARTVCNNRHNSFKCGHSLMFIWMHIILYNYRLLMRSTHDHEDRVRYWLTDAAGGGQPIPDKVFMVMSRPKSKVYYCFIKLSGIFLHKDWNIHSYCFLSRPLS